MQWLLYQEGEHMVPHNDHVENRASRSGIARGSAITTFTLGSYAMDFVLFNKPKARREKHGAERCRWSLSHNTMLIMGERDAMQWHAARQTGRQ